MKADSEKAFLEGLSPQAREKLSAAIRQPRTQLPAAGDLEAWKRLQDLVEARSEPACRQAIDEYNPVIAEKEFAGVPCLVIRPAGEIGTKPPLVFIHGGGYTTFSARASLFASVPLAAALERTVISVDYPLAPASKYDNTVPLVTAALTHLLEEYPRAALAGDSAGGGLALAACNRLLRDPGRRFSALVLISPWTDLGDRGDSRLTQRDHDPLLRYEGSLADCAAAYAPGAVDHPGASPVFAEYDQNFPPTLIVCGTREILLSDSVRLARRLREAGARVVLDVHDGLHHSFPVITPTTPEADKARATIREFLDTLDGDDR